MNVHDIKPQTIAAKDPREAVDTIKGIESEHLSQASSENKRRVDVFVNLVKHFTF